MPLSDFQIGTAQYDSAQMNAENNISRFMSTNPHVLSQLIYAAGEAYGNEKLGASPYALIQHLTSTGHGEPEVVNSDEIHWNVVGRMMKPLTVTTPPDFSVSAKLGQGKVPFTFRVAERLAHKNWTLRTSRTGKMIMLTKDLEKVGNEWEAEAIICGNDPEDFISAADFPPGVELTWISTNVGEFSDGGGTLTTFPFKMRNGFSTRRMGYTATGDSKYTAIVVKLPSLKGKSSLKVKVPNGGTVQEDGCAWIDWVEWQYLKHWLWQRERGLWFDKNTRMANGNYAYYTTDNTPIKVGSGLEEQLELVNKYKTSVITQEYLWQMLADIQYNSGNDNSLNLVCYTGLGFITEFSKAMEKAAGRYSFVREEGTFIKPGEGNKLSYGAQFTTFRGLEGTSFTVVNHPMFNDRTIFPEMSKKGFTKQSYKAYFINHALFNGQPQVKLFTKGDASGNRKDLHWYVAGAELPKGMSEKTLLRASSRDGYERYSLCSEGIILLNPWSNAVLELDV